MASPFGSLSPQRERQELQAKEHRVVTKVSTSEIPDEVLADVFEYLVDVVRNPDAMKLRRVCWKWLQGLTTLLLRAVNNQITRGKFEWVLPMNASRSYSRQALLALRDAPPEFLEQIQTLDGSFLPNWMHIVPKDIFAALPKLRKITNHFMLEAPNLKTLDLTECPVEEVGEKFLRRAKKLKSIQLPVSLRSVGPDFLADCRELVSLDLSKAVLLTALPDNCFALTMKLATLQLPSSLVTIGNGVLREGKMLKKLDLSHTAVTTIGICFCQDAEELIEVLLPTTLKEVGDGFLLRCGSLQRLDLSSLHSLSSPNSGIRGFIMGPRCLTEVRFPTHWTSFPPLALQGANSLRRLDLSEMKDLTTIGQKFFQFTSLEELILPSSITTIESSFLSQSTELKVLDLSRCTALTTVGNSFLANAKRLQVVKLPDSVTTIEAFFCAGAPHLETIDLSNLTQVTNIDKNFLSTCQGLKHLRLPPTVTAVDSNFLDYTSGLDTLDLRHASQLTSLGSSFLNYSNVVSLHLPVSVTTLAVSFMGYTECLQNLDLSALTGITKIPSTFLGHSRMLVSLTLPTSITDIEDLFLFHSRALRALDLRYLRNLAKIGNRFAANSEVLEVILLPESIVTIGDGMCSGCPTTPKLENLAHLTALTTVGTRFPYPFTAPAVAGPSASTTSTVEPDPPNAE